MSVNDISDLATINVPLQFGLRVKLDATLVAEEGAGFVSFLVCRHVLCAGEQLSAHVAHRRRVTASASDSS